MPMSAAGRCTSTTAAAPRAVAARATHGASGSGGMSWQPEDAEAQLDGRFDKSDLIDAFSRAALQQQGRPREDVRSYMEPAPVASSSKAPQQPSFPAWCELMQSMDSTDVIDWSDVENDGWGSSAAAEQSRSNSRGSSSPPAAAAAVAVAAGVSSRGALWSGPASSSSSSNSSMTWGCNRVGRRGAIAMRAVPSSKEADTEPDDTPHYEGADSDTLFPVGSLEMDDPGHPTDVAGGAKDVQAAVVRPEARPYMNIKNGRWVPPSKSQAEAMMGQLSQMGPDEGV